MAVPLEMLFHPELLSNEQLIQIINERHLRVENLHRMRRDELLDLFHEFCVPYGQRKYRDSGRGKLLNKTRNVNTEYVTFFNTLNSSIKLNRRTIHSDIERVKAPPDLLSGQMKRIKLDNISATDNSLKNKRKMSIDKTALLDVTPIKRERNPITWP